MNTDEISRLVIASYRVEGHLVTGNLGDELPIKPGQVFSAATGKEVDMNVVDFLAIAVVNDQTKVAGDLQTVGNHPGGCQQSAHDLRRCPVEIGVDVVRDDEQVDGVLRAVIGNDHHVIVLVEHLGGQLPLPDTFEHGSHSVYGIEHARPNQVPKKIVGGILPDAARLCILSGYHSLERPYHI